MEFNEKLQELRKQSSLTQEELAEKLYVSRTAISKWESGRGYPNIESLKIIAKFFSVTIDELLSSDEVLFLAQEDNKQKECRLRDLIFGLVDVFMALLLFLPFFAEQTNGVIRSVSLISLSGVQPYLKALYLIFVSAQILVGILIIVLRNFSTEIFGKNKIFLSLIFSVILVLLFIISLQPYAAVYAFSALIFKLLMFIKQR